MPLPASAISDKHSQTVLALAASLVAQDSERLVRALIAAQLLPLDLLHTISQ
jgi:hypothetical protein